MFSMATQAIPRLKSMNNISSDSTTVSEIERNYTFLKEGRYPGTHNMGRLEEKGDTLGVQFSDVSHVLLGEKKQNYLDVVQKFSKRPAVLKSDPIMTITFFKKFLAAEVARNETSLWTVTFTPVCSGPPITSVHFKELKSPVQKQFMVTGKPKVGDRVCKGPHWNYGLSVEERLGIMFAKDHTGIMVRRELLPMKRKVDH